jgi:Tol biopolymer transport system component
MTMTIQSVDIYKMPMDPLTGKSLGAPALLRYTPTGSNVSPVWAPDGKHIAFFTYYKDKKEQVLVITSDDGSEKREFILPPKCGSGALRWTPDGEAIGFAGPDSSQKYNLFRLTLSTGEWEKWPLELGYWAMMEWGKDGKTYYFSDNGLQGAEEKIVKCSIGNSERHNIFPEAMNQKGAFRSLRCSRDYKSMAFHYGNGISVMDLETEESHLVTPVADTPGKAEPTVNWKNPSWSPDGDKMLVTKSLTDEKMNETFELHILDVGTGDTQKIDLGDTLPRDVSITATDWSPDGKGILLGCMTWVMEDHLMQTVIPKEYR